MLHRHYIEAMLGLEGHCSRLTLREFLIILFAYPPNLTMHDP